MAEITFSSDNARERFDSCKAFTEKRGDKSLQRCIDNLKRWKNPIFIGLDFDKMSFSFREELPADLQAKGYTSVVGGILYHGPRDGYGSGNGPTFAVCIDGAEGYRIHT